MVTNLERPIAQDQGILVVYARCPKGGFYRFCEEIVSLIIESIKLKLQISKYGGNIYILGSPVRPASGIVENSPGRQPLQKPWRQKMINRLPAKANPIGLR
ncbi:Uncharacterised protein [uncultured archaeon]|nr:Uncharacterised protein [uncultured archaeon]